MDEHKLILQAAALLMGVGLLIHYALGFAIGFYP